MWEIGEMRGRGRVGFGQTAQRYRHTEVVLTLSGQLTLTKSAEASGKSVMQDILFRDHAVLGKLEGQVCGGRCQGHPWLLRPRRLDTNHFSPP